jgi:hypothetical protein
MFKKYAELMKYEPLVPTGIGEFNEESYVFKSNFKKFKNDNESTIFISLTFIIFVLALILRRRKFH